MKIKLWLKDTSQPREYDNVINTYPEDLMFCIHLKDKILKYPIFNIFRVEEIEEVDDF